VEAEQDGEQEAKVPEMEHFTTRDVTRILDLPADKVRRYARADFMAPERGPRNEYRFTFHDLVLMRTARELEVADVSPRRIHRALRDLRSQLPAERSLTALRIVADGDRIVVREGETTWSPESGQVQIDFRVADFAAAVEPFVAGTGTRPWDGDDRTADDWYELAFSLEGSSPGEAREMYARALELDPDHADALVNLGRLFHEDGAFEEARERYERALGVNPTHATAAFNLGVVLEDLEQTELAADAYRKAIETDPRMADAYYNLSRLCEESGDRPAALRYLRSYDQLTRTRGPRPG
jgi:tetratricopeptide (TPR) repeat protein